MTELFGTVIGGFRGVEYGHADHVKVFVAHGENGAKNGIRPFAS
jgi:hypothetical protein